MSIRVSPSAVRPQGLLSLRGVTASLTSTVLVAIAVFAASPAHAEATALKSSATDRSGNAVSTVLAGDDITLSAVMPVANQKDKLVQEIVQDVDNTYMELAGANSITAPRGWQLSYSIDGKTFTSTPSNWDAVVKIKARGTLDSYGATPSGMQVNAGSATIPTPPVLQIPAAASGGDGYSVDFDERGYIYNMYHHDSPKAIDCHLRKDASSCPGGKWPFNVGTYGLHANNNAVTFTDNQNHHIWFPTNTSTSAGIGCVDVSDIANPTMCGGSLETGYFALGGTGNANHSVAGQIAGIGRNVYSFNTATGQLMCVDYLANAGMGGPCASAPPTLSQFRANLLRDFDFDLATLDSLLFGHQVSTGGVFCINTATMGKCPNWANYEVNVGSGSNTLGKDRWSVSTMYFVPNTSGNIVGVCFSPQKKCVTGDNDTITGPINTALADVIDAQSYAQVPVVSGTRVVWMNGAFAKARCFDVSTNAWCANWGDGINHSTFKYGGYTVTLDPENSNCVWTNSDDGRIRSYDLLKAQLGCSSPPGRVSFSRGLVPINTCDGKDSVQSWGTFALTGIPAADYTNAYLTIKTADGNVLTSGGTTWSRVLIPRTGNRTVDLSAIDPSESGFEPVFQVDFTGRTSMADVGAQVIVTGGSPMLCVDLTARGECPVELEPLSLSAWTHAFTVAGNATNSAKVVTTMTPDSSTLNRAALDGALCGAILSGTARDPGGTPLKGVTVSLRDSAGAELIYPVYYEVKSLRGKPITAVTDADGNYTFAVMSKGDYNVVFADEDQWHAISAEVKSGDVGSDMSLSSAADGAARSLKVVVGAGVPGVVDGVLTLVSAAEPDKATVESGDTVTIDLLKNDLDGPGVTLDGSMVTICPVENFAAGYNATTCTLKPTEDDPLVTEDGSYWLDPETGKLTFKPRPGFTGEIRQPLRYLVDDGTGYLTSATVKVAVKAAPVVPTRDPLPHTGGSPMSRLSVVFLLLAAGFALKRAARIN